MRNFIFGGWIFGSIALLLYSFTQVDLSLTLSQASVWQVIQKSFQYVGWFNRPLSAGIYISLIIFLFILYGITIKLINKNNLEKRSLWKIIILVSVILFFSYNAFSYDLFNYIFDAKIVTEYGQNPYEHKALDYPGDPMLSFMRWTHRTYPYGPFWLVLTVPLSFIGFGYFLLTFYLFKLLAVLSFIGSIFLIDRISEKNGFNGKFTMAAFALNPLVMIESLVSAHNDIVMIFFGLLAVSFFLERKLIKSLLSTVASVFIKYATVLLIPGLILKEVFKISIEKFFYILTISMLFGALLVTFRTNFQPWYLLLALPFASFVQDKYFVMIPLFIISFAALLQYLPYLYLGNWDPPVPLVLNLIMLSGVILSVVVVFFLKLNRGNNNNQIPKNK